MRNSLRQTDSKAALDACFFISCLLLFVVLCKFLLHTIHNFADGNHFAYLISTAREMALPSFFILIVSVILMLIQRINFHVCDILAIPYNDMKYSHSYAFFFKFFRSLGILFFIFCSFIFIHYLFSNAYLFITGVLIASILFAQFAKINGWHD